MVQEIFNTEMMCHTKKISPLLQGMYEQPNANQKENSQRPKDFWWKLEGRAFPIDSSDTITAQKNIARDILYGYKIDQFPNQPVPWNYGNP